MRDFNEDDWKEVCRNIRENARKFRNSMTEEELRPYLETPINELMGYSLKDYSKTVDCHSGEIHEHIYKICCLENVTDDVQHWRHEILTHVNSLFNPVMKAGMKKDKILMNNLIKIAADEKTFEPDGDGLFISAMNSEIANARRHPENIRLKKESEYIKKYILPNITAYRKANAKRVADLLKAIYDGILKNDRDIIEVAMDKFIDAKTEVRI